MKKILCVNYSQSGQLDQIVENLIATIKDVEIHRVHAKPATPFAFPWNPKNFYNPMPETVMEEPIPMEPMNLHDDYDLIILGYQPWFLSPSLPTTSLLKTEEMKRAMAGTKVVTVIGARNMWLNAQDSIVQLVQDNGGRMVGNIALVDRAMNHLSAVSIAHWMMTGKKTRKWGIFPLPGVSDEDIQGTGKFGKIISEALAANNYHDLQTKLIAADGLRINTNILFIEGKAKKIFRIWANVIKKKEAQGKNRAFWIAFFRVYLNIALFGVAPILLLFYNLLVRPFTTNKIKRKKQHFAYLGITE